MSNTKAFVLMPFAEELSDVYQYLISDGLRNAGYDVKRADDILSQNNILEDIVAGIVSSDLIVADLTGANPNVYYELGIAHALNKSVILLAQDIDELPFDLRSYRVVSYSVHFAKMNQAREELCQLASEAIKGNIPFGNPVKDFCRTKSNGVEEVGPFSNPMEEDQEGEYGLLDYRVKLEDGFEELSEIISDVGSRLENEVTPEITKSGEKLTSGKCSAKQQRNIVRELASHLQQYGTFVKPNNEKYRVLLNDIENSLEFILGGGIEVEHDAANELQKFIEALSQVEESAFQGRQGFVSLIEAMDALPKIEKNFNRANVFMAKELREFVGNIDQTIAVISRATRLGQLLIAKTLSA
uniref:Nucleoside 2-deoxyribosyltransferase n=1 Tax=Candidatus Kentrum sp. DK TaxID=2126562 RepID=A0A450SEU3_9GAMM|nr:MAG: hypothetical protein BECKDK2373C_GA0170839_103145 [Candidatus Kentron sp. DK]